MIVHHLSLLEFYYSSDFAPGLFIFPWTDFFLFFYTFQLCPLKWNLPVLHVQSRHSVLLKYFFFQSSEKWLLLLCGIHCMEGAAHSLCYTPVLVCLNNLPCQTANWVILWSFVAPYHVQNPVLGVGEKNRKYSTTTILKEFILWEENTPIKKIIAISIISIQVDVFTSSGRWDNLFYIFIVVIFSTLLH